MIVRKVQMTWDNVSVLPTPLKFKNASVRANRYDSSRVYFEFPAQAATRIHDAYGQIKVWLLDARCVSIQYTYEGELPIHELERLNFYRSNGGDIWRMKHAHLAIAALPVANAGTWILSIENRRTKRGVLVSDCDLKELFSVQLTIDAYGEIIGL